ncbi:MAG TPA: riboflavin synthase [Bacillota bacterium]
MFTGIVEEVGTITQINKVSEQAIQLRIRSTKVVEDVALGDSISVNGVCLTVTHFLNDEFCVDVMPETIKSTSLQSLTTGSKVNLERSMAANGRFGGHFVSGHVDATGTIMRKERQENAIYYDIQIPKELTPFVMLKGSIAVDGISLTIFAVSDQLFQISLIPHTARETILGQKREGDLVNIECDMLAKYVHRMLQQTNGEQVSERIDEDFLRTNGFIKE